MRFVVRLAALALLAGSALGLSGCHYGINRYYDFRDMFAVGVGLTSENPVTGEIPPSFGAYLELTDYLHFGWITHNGFTAESDLRGTFVGPEFRTRAGLLWWQMLQINQDYENGHTNAFKDKDFSWSQRMSSPGFRHNGHPAKRLNYEYFSQFKQAGQMLRHRGYQYWEYTGVELALSDPIFTHFGFLLKLGFDLSEFSDFILGVFTVDFKRDDLTPDEFAELHPDWAYAYGAAPMTAPAEPRGEDSPIQSEPAPDDEPQLEPPPPPSSEQIPPPQSSP